MFRRWLCQVFAGATESTARQRKETCGHGTQEGSTTERQHEPHFPPSAAVLRLTGEELSALAWQEVAALGDEPLPHGVGGVFGRLPAITLPRDRQGRRQTTRALDRPDPLSCHRAEEIFEVNTVSWSPRSPLPRTSRTWTASHSTGSAAVRSRTASRTAAPPPPMLPARSRHASGVCIRVPLRQNRQPAAGRFILSESDGSTCNMGFRSCRRFAREG
ncbi:hypothetical protein GCM10010300_82580 [Streptomyces olivaceoviridis]|nr:hypothetical protein GCM10010300_82580 [Streptomyces olivaceoviridis]